MNSVNLVTSQALYIVLAEGGKSKAFADYMEAISYARTASRVFGTTRFTVQTEAGRPICQIYQGRQVAVTD